MKATTTSIATAEARGLKALLKAGETPASIRALIKISPAETTELTRLGMRVAVLRSIELRMAVLAEFEKLVGDIEKR